MASMDTTRTMMVDQKLRKDGGMPGYSFLEQFGNAEEWDHASNASVSSSMNTSSLSYRTPPKKGSTCIDEWMNHPCKLTRQTPMIEVKGMMNNLRQEE